MDQKDIRQLYAMLSKKKPTDQFVAMQNERYQRTFTDEYLFNKKSRGRASVPVEVREGWKKLREQHDHDSD